MHDAHTYVCCAYRVIDKTNTLWKQTHTVVIGTVTLFGSTKIIPNLRTV